MIIDNVFLFFLYVSNFGPVDQFLFCFVFPFYVSRPPCNRKYPSGVRAPFVCTAKSKKKVPLRRPAQLFLEKKSGECIGPPSTRHTLLVSCWIFSFPNRPRYAPCCYGVFPFSSHPRVGRSSRRGRCPKPEAHTASGGWRPMRLLFSSQGHLL